jgi:hypothetical protein
VGISVGHYKEKKLGIGVGSYKGKKIVVGVTIGPKKTKTLI